MQFLLIQPLNYIYVLLRSFVLNFFKIEQHDNPMIHIIYREEGGGGGSNYILI